jgi:hemolysin III
MLFSKDIRKKTNGFIMILNKLRNPISGLTHFIGACFAIWGLVLLILKGVYHGDTWHVVSFVIFGAALIMLYTSSTLYHWLPLSEKGVAKMRQLDHMMIFVLISGTYTPVCLTILRGGWGWSMFGIIWGIAIFGFVSKILWMNAPRWLYVALYLLMGWTALMFIYPISQKMSGGGIFWLFIGGVAYSLGAVGYALKKPDPFPGVFGFHEIWHLFVMAGSYCHFHMVYFHLT